VTPRETPAAHAPWWFFGLTIGWTWALWGSAALTTDDWLEPHSLVLFVLGGAGPLLAALLLVGRGRADESLGSFCRRAVDPRVLAPRWWLAITTLAVLPPAVVRFGVHGPGDGLAVAAPAAFLLVGALAGAAEEPGWRGYAQEGLQRRMSMLAASVVVGGFWTAWHLPLFWLPGTYQHGLGIGTRDFWSFQIAILVGTVLYAWLYNAAGRVTLAAVWFHAAANVANELFPAEEGGWWSLSLHAAIAVTVLVASWGRMTRRGECSPPGDRSTSQPPTGTRSWSDHGNR
jgi:uncharacterized protein